MHMPALFDPVRTGAWTLANRIIMAPLTRQRAGAERIPNAMMGEYYRQRASAGLIISEATSVDPMGVGYPDTPGIWSDDQVRGWSLVTDAVHAEGGRIFLQLWHVGRLSDPMYLHGKLPVAPSAIAPRADAHDMGDSNLAQTFGYVARELGRRRIAFLCAREGGGEGRLGPELKKAFGGVYIANQQFTRESAEQVISAGEADAVAF